MSKCQFCGQTNPPYTCPRCFSPYCSLKCYKCPNHSNCSESFYKEFVEEEAKLSYVDQSERQKFLELLRRSASDVNNMESDYLQDGNQEEFEGDVLEELNERVSGLNLDRDADELWSRLSSEEKQEFERLMTSGEILNIVPRWKPWWKTYSKANLDANEAEDDEALKKLSKFKNFLSGSSTSPLEADIVSIIFAYCLLCRFYNGDYKNNCDDFVCYILEICPCFDGSEHRPAKDAATSILEVHHRIIAHSGDLSQSFDSKFSEKIIRDAVLILQVHEKRAVFRMLADLLSIFTGGISLLKSQRGDDSTLRKKSFVAKKKLQFLAGWAVWANFSVFQNCCGLLSGLATTLFNDRKEFDVLKEEVEVSGVCDTNKVSANLIEEL